MSERLSCRRIGNGAKHIVFLHGFSVASHTWEDIVPLLAGSEYTLHLLDLKGHGGSLKPVGGDYSLAHHSRLVGQYLNDHSISSTVLVGHSLGGAISLITALDCPAVTSLILIGAPALPQHLPRFMRILRIPVMGPLLMALVPARYLARKGLQAAFHHRDRISERRISLYASGYGSLSSSRALAATVRALIPANAGQILERYSELQIPVLLLWGEHDRIVWPIQGQRLCEILPGATMHIISDCGHNPQEEKPAETAAAIALFLKHLA